MAVRSLDAEWYASHLEDHYYDFTVGVELGAQQIGLALSF